MSKTTWADVVKGDRVGLNGRTFTVTKYKAKGKRIKVTLTGSGFTGSSEVRSKDAVTIVPLSDKQRDAKGWHKPSKAERKAEAKPKGLPPGDPTMLKPPAKPSGDSWAETRGKTEAKLDKYLSAHLVGESFDEGGGYYVPPVDVTTVAAHLTLFHGLDTSNPNLGDEAQLLSAHAYEHEAGGTLAVNHWHTKTRPEVTS